MLLRHFECYFCNFLYGIVTFGNTQSCWKWPTRYKRTLAVGSMTGKVNCILGCCRIRVVRNLREMIPSVYSTLERLHLESSFGLSSLRETWSQGYESTVKDHWHGWETSESNIREEKNAAGAVTVQPREEKIWGWGDLINVYKYLSDHQKILWVQINCWQHDASLHLQKMKQWVLFWNVTMSSAH